MSNKITDLPKKLKIARNHGVLGNYKEALSEYKITLEILNTRISEVSDSFLKEKWKIVEAEIKSEISQCSALYNLCSSFKTTPFETDKKQKDYNIPKNEYQKDVNKLNEITANSNNNVNKEIKDNKEFKRNNSNRAISNNNNANYNDFKSDFNVNMNNFNNKEREYSNNNNNINNNNNSNSNNNNNNNYKVNYHNNNISSKEDRNSINKINNNNNYINKKENKKTNTDETNLFELTNIISDFNNKELNNQNNNFDFDDLNFNINDYKEKKKDPLVWDNDENYDNRIIKKIPPKKEIAKPVKRPTNKEKISNLYKEAENYKANKDKSKKEGQQGGMNKSYLNHIYPDGNGPDTHLIESLETEVVNQNPNVSFEEIADLDAAKNILKEAVLLPLLFPKFFQGIRRPWKGVLLYGPPGTGKTMLAKAMATQGKTTFFNVHSSSFASKWRGESEKLVRILFEMARYYAPTIIFIDEVDAICSKRNDGDGDSSRRVLTEFLVQMDGCNTYSSANVNIEENNNNNNNNNNNKGKEEANNNNNNDKEKSKLIMVMAATNRPWDLDKGVIRRFEKRVYIPLPTETGRKELFKINLVGVKVDDKVDYDKLVNLTEGYSGADIANVCREAALMNMRRRLLNNQENIMELVNKTGFKNDINAPISEEDLVDAVKNISKSVSNDDLKSYDVWTQEYKSS